MVKISKKYNISYMITKIESTSGAIAPISLIKYRLLNQIHKIKRVWIILRVEMSISTSKSVKTTILVTTIMKSTMLHILYKASFPRVFVYIINTKILAMFKIKERMLNTFALLRLFYKSSLPSLSRLCAVSISFLASSY